MVYYQVNPQANWGPASRAKNVKAAPTAGTEKRKPDTGNQERETKKAKVEDGEEDAKNGA